MSVNFVHQSFLSRVICKPGAVELLPNEMLALGCKRPLVLSSVRVASSHLFQQVTLLLHGLKVANVGAIPQHSSEASVLQVVDVARQHGADSFICLGGGSVSDTAKAAAIVLSEGGPLSKHATRFEPPSTVVVPSLLKTKLPIISVPLTASGAEVTPSLGIRDESNTKLLFWDAHVASRVILIDAQANMEIPSAIMLSTAMNGLAHCIEGLYSKASSPVSSALALDAIVRFNQAIRAVADAPTSMQAREDLLIAAHMSGLVLASAKSCLHHAICHVLGAKLNLPHGVSNSIILPHAIAFNRATCVAEFQSIEQRLGLAENASVGTWLLDLQRAAGVPTRLRDADIAESSLDSIAQATLHERGLAINPRQVESAAQIREILAAAW
jgi:alcohol dehydrogenase class IV